MEWVQRTKPDPERITRLLASWSGGRQSALDELMPLVYGELRHLAAAYLRRERLDHTLQPTALVHEAYMRLVDQSIADCRTRAQFFGIAAHLMRQILVNHAKRHRAAKRGGGNKVALGEGATLAGESPLVNVLAVDRALNKLAQFDLRQSRIVEMRWFAGLPEDEIAQALQVSLSTVKRDWVMAKSWLRAELADPQLAPGHLMPPTR